MKRDTLKLPIIFSKHYDIAFMGLENLHPFDTKKYGKVYKYLIKKTGIRKEQFFTPQIATTQDLLLVHSKGYLESLSGSDVIAFIAEVPLLNMLPGKLLQRVLLKPMKYGTGGTILGSQLALQYGWAINLSGGYHHAKAEQGGGFCFYADIAIATFKLWEQKPDTCILIVDLDAHQGNGYASIFKKHKKVKIFDIYNESIYPFDLEAKAYINFDYPVPAYINDSEYLTLLKRHLPEAVKKTSPDLIIYNAGTDIFTEDALGGLNISAGGIIQRDGLVFQNAQQNKIPILMLLAGGYSLKSAEIIGRSIENIIKKYI